MDIPAYQRFTYNNALTIANLLICFLLDVSALEGKKQISKLAI